MSLIEENMNFNMRRNKIRNYVIGQTRPCVHPAGHPPSKGEINEIDAH